MMQLVIKKMLLIRRVKIGYFRSVHTVASEKPGSFSVISVR
jgi:hypothetical protein